MKFVAHIRRNADGVVRDHEFEDKADTFGEKDGEEGLGTYMWGEGNFACDCNRAIFFAANDEDDEHKCGETAFSVQIVDGSGTIVYQDDAWEDPIDRRRALT